MSMIKAIPKNYRKNWNSKNGIISGISITTLKIIRVSRWRTGLVLRVEQI